MIIYDKLLLWQCKLTVLPVISCSRELSFNPFITSYPCSVHILVFPKHQYNAAQNQLCSSHIAISHLSMAVISQPHNQSGSFLCHFKEL